MAGAVAVAAFVVLAPSLPIGHEERKKYYYYNGTIRTIYDKLKMLAEHSIVGLSRRIALATNRQTDG